MSKKSEKPDLTNMMVLNRNYTLISTMGYSIHFEKDVPTLVPPAIRREALAIGALPADGEEPNVLKDDNKPQEPTDPAERNEAIMKAVLAMVEQNQREDFTAAGAPKKEAVEKLVGFKVDKREVAAVWQEYHEQKVAQ